MHNNKLQTWAGILLHRFLTLPPLFLTFGTPLNSKKDIFAPESKESNSGTRIERNFNSEPELKESNSGLKSPAQ